VVAADYLMRIAVHVILRQGLRHTYTDGLPPFRHVSDPGTLEHARASVSGRPESLPLFVLNAVLGVSTRGAICRSYGAGVKTANDVSARESSVRARRSKASDSSRMSNP
jgi:hypothetical protein